MDWAFFQYKWLQFLWNFQRQKIIVRLFGKKEGKKISEIRVTFENLEKMRKLEKWNVKMSLSWSIFGLAQKFKQI